MSAAARPPSGLGRDAAAAIAGVGLEKLVALGIALYLPRALGLTGYGQYALVVSYLGFFQVLPDAALEAVLVTRLARAAGDARAVAGRGAAVRLLVSLAGAALGIAVLAAVTRDAALIRAAAIAATGLAAVAATPYRPLLRARLRLDRYLVLVGGQSALALGLLALAIRAGGGLDAVLAAVATAAGGGLVLGRLLVGRGARLVPDPALGRRLVTDAWPLAGTTLSLIGAQHVVLQLILLRLHGAAAVGLLAGAQKLVEAIGLAHQALMLSVLPALSAAAAAPAEAVERAREAARVLLILIVPAALALALWAEPVLLTVFGPALAGAATTVRVLAPAAVLGATGAVLTNLLLALGQQRILLRVTVGSALLMIGLGVVLVPSAGAPGAAAAAVGSMLAGQLALCALAPTRRRALPVVASALRPLGLGGAIAVAASWTSPLAGFALLAIGYPIALVATGTVTRADLSRWGA
jgi:O-antigen/teichoic acid export membrane protein